ncbi:glycosyltransferase family 1 protein [Paenibacillus sp. JX-17]|uniref:Glycosyltransferase family 1 protein n=1 Tax=Paenibacillus lacisoli TaxID=3064525 RepID=A0ABT9CIN3_9BACL|nr:glycosyltransferase family 1 protein [Paenibacillus sp. JX-17]MDO7908393.1 glycosyltransferase family 1 protein [Paenibacillus sp. JX-17]
MRKTKVYINGRFLTQSITGVQRYAFELIKSLDRMIDERDPALSPYEWIVLAPRGEIHDPGLQHIEIRQVGRFSGHVWEQLVLPFHTAGGFLLNLCNTGPLLKRNQGVTLHDTAVYVVPESYSAAFKLWYKVLFRILGVTSKVILTCSENSKRQLMEFCKIKDSKIHVIYHGKEHILRTHRDPDFLERKGLNKPFVLAVSSMSPNKNFRSIVKAIEIMGQPGFDIVIAGGTNPKVFKTPEAQLTDNVKYMGYVEDEELRTLYNEAAGFVFPSFYEGFGFPPLEAMACGCPVISSNAASLPEVCGDAVLYCDPNSPQDIADKIQLLMSDSMLREQLSRQGLKQAQSFSWEKCTRETLAVLSRYTSAKAVAAENTSAGVMAGK